MSETPVLEIKNLVKKFPEVTAVNNISFNMTAGTCFGLLGPNGAGKTTTIEIVEGILSPTSGEVLYKGAPRGKRFVQETGIQLQSTELPLFLTVRETLTMFRNLYQKRASLDKLIATCHLEEIIDRDSGKISGGQKQRLLLAMALCNDPELIFLDEPTTGLDPQARRHLWDIVQKLKQQNKTIVLTTHYMEEAELLCDHIAIMDHGGIIAEGSPTQLLTHHCKGASITLQHINGDLPPDFRWKWFRLESGEILIQADHSDTCIRELVRAGIDLTGISIKPQNMEDLFLKLTGHELRS